MPRIPWPLRCGHIPATRQPTWPSAAATIRNATKRHTEADAGEEDAERESSAAILDKPLTGPTVGDQVEIRPEVAPGHRISGLITRIAPAASRTIAEQALTHLGGGPIAVDLQTAQAEQPYFEITVDTQLTESPFLRHGMVCHVRFKTDSETIGARLLRRLIRFTDMIAQR